MVIYEEAGVRGGQMCCISSVGVGNVSVERH